jgi:hypothetical protein
MSSLATSNEATPGSQRAGGSEPHAVELQVCLLPEHVVVVVVVKDAKPVVRGERRDEQVDGREAVMADPGELALRVERSALDVGIDHEVGESKQFPEHGFVISGTPGGVAGFQEERRNSSERVRFRAGAKTT